MNRGRRGIHTAENQQQKRRGGRAESEWNKRDTDWWWYQQITTLVNRNIVVMTKTDRNKNRLWGLPLPDVERGCLALCSYLSHAAKKFITCHRDTHTSPGGHSLQCKTLFTLLCFPNPNNVRLLQICLTLLCCGMQNVLQKLIRMTDSAVCANNTLEQICDDSQQAVVCLTAIVCKCKNRMQYSWSQWKSAWITV